MTTKQHMIEAIAEHGAISSAQAEKVLSVFIKVKAVKFGAHDGFMVTHGAFMDREVIRRALSQAK